MNTLDARRRLLGRNVYKKTVEGNPAIAQGSLARMYPGIEMQGWTEQAQYEGNQLFDASKLHTKTQGGATVTNNGDGSFTISGSGNLTSVFSNPYTYPSDEAARIISREGTCRLNSDFDTSVFPGFLFGLYDNTGSPIAYKRITSHSNALSFEITQDDIDKVSSGEYALKAYFFGEANKPIHVGVVRPAVYIDGDGTWEPYTGGQPSPSPDYPQEIVSAGEYDEETQKYQYEVQVTGANLFDISKVNTLNGIVNNGDGSITVNTPSGSSAISTNKTLRDLCHGITPGTYFLQADSTGQNQYIYIDRIWNFGTSTELTDEDLDKYVLLYASGVNTTGTISNIMINHGSTALPYEPYRTPQTVLLTTDRPLTKWDKLTKKNGVWGWEYGSAEIEITEESPLQKYAADKISLYVSDAYLFGTPYSDKYVCQNGVPVTENRIGLSSGSHAFVIYDTAYLGDVELYKQWLSENPLTLWYETDTKTFVPLSEAEQAALNALHTNRPTTILSNDAGCEMSLTYKTKKSLEVTA